MKLQKCINQGCYDFDLKTLGEVLEEVHRLVAEFGNGAQICFNNQRECDTTFYLFLTREETAEEYLVRVKREGMLEESARVRRLAEYNKLKAEFGE